jgi:glutamate/tyrosine decarboxylase-like PLP-dependent enzyme
MNYGGSFYELKNQHLTPEENSALFKDKMILQYLLEQTRQAAARQLDRQENLSPGRRIEDIPLEDLPDQGWGTEIVLRHFEDQFASKIANTAGPRYFGFVTGGSTPASIAGDWIVSALDQNSAGSNDGIAPQMERQTIHFLKQLFHLDEKYFGSFVTGATMSNFVGLATARQWIGEQRGIDFSMDGLSDAEKVIVLSGTPHSSIYKSLSMLGLGRNSVVKIDTLPDREALDINHLERHLKEAPGPVIVVANAGTVNTVDFDDLEAIGKLKKRVPFWMHVDAAFGGYAACSPKYAHLLNGINHADSITIDAHKWLNVPYDSAMQFTRHQVTQGKVFQNQAAYLGGNDLGPDYLHYTPENSRRFRALPAWFTLMAYGRSGYREIVNRNCALARLLADLLDASSLFNLLSPVRMNVVCFTVNRKDVTMASIQRFLNRVRDDGRAMFTPTLYKGTPAIRAAISNWKTEENDILIAYNALEEVYQNTAEFL